MTSSPSAIAGAVFWDQGDKKMSDAHSNPVKKGKYCPFSKKEELSEFLEKQLFKLDSCRAITLGTTDVITQEKISDIAAKRLWNDKGQYCGDYFIAVGRRSFKAFNGESAESLHVYDAFGYLSAVSSYRAVGSVEDPSKNPLKTPLEDLSFYSINLREKKLDLWLKLEFNDKFKTWLNSKGADHPEKAKYQKLSAYILGSYTDSAYNVAEFYLYFDLAEEPFPEDPEKSQYWLERSVSKEEYLGYFHKSLQLRQDKANKKNLKLAFEYLQKALELYKTTQTVVQEKITALNKMIKDSKFPTLEQTVQQACREELSYWKNRQKKILIKDLDYIHFALACDYTSGEGVAVDREKALKHINKIKDDKHRAIVLESYNRHGTSNEDGKSNKAAKGKKKKATSAPT